MEVATADKPVTAKPPLEGLRPDRLVDCLARADLVATAAPDAGTVPGSYGEMFTYRLPTRHVGGHLQPRGHQQVFTGDPRLLHAGEANIVLLPVLGSSPCCFSTSPPT